MSSDSAYDPASASLRIDPHAPPGSPVAEPTFALRRAIEAARSRRFVDERFRTTLCEYVAELKAAGVTAEKVLVTIKHHIGPHAPVRVVEQASQWCLAAFYGLKD